MKIIKHSKYKNTGLLFELLIRQITSDTLNNKDSKAFELIKKYFTKSELAKEYRLYESVIKEGKYDEKHANYLIQSILNQSQKLNKTSLRRDKYNLIKEIKENYNLDEFFSLKVPNYKQLASLYILIESYSTKDLINPKILMESNFTLLEHLTHSKEITKDSLLEEYSTYDKDLKILTHKILLEKFNTKYNNLSKEQKQILKEYIISVDSSNKLKTFYNETSQKIKTEILKESKKFNNKVLNIKINEICKYINPLEKNQKVNNDDLVDLLLYQEVLNEIKNLNA